jgi:hypothetical protein
MYDGFCTVVPKVGTGNYVRNDAILSMIHVMHTLFVAAIALVLKCGSFRLICCVSEKSESAV